MIKKYTFLMLGLFVTGFMQTSTTRAQNVDQFTGDFSYSVPLITVPSPYGPGVSIGAGYGAGIGVKQGSSEIGLGWSINAGGAISRSVSGFPDDWNGALVGGPKGFTAESGAFHGVGKDFYTSLQGTNQQKFTFPDYDSYFVNGPGIGGQLTPHLFDYTTTNITTGEYVIESPGFTKKAQFIFKGDFADTLVSRQYPTTPVSQSTVLKLPGTPVVIDKESSSADPYMGKRDEGFDRTSNRLASSKYVEYFSNAEISAGVIGLMDFKTPHTRTATDFELNEIGGFRITDEAGFVYHYSLPVYINYAIYGNYPLNNDYSIPTYTLTAPTINGNNYTIANVNANPNNSNLIVEYKQGKKYAYTWLLTAVTGPAFEDVNANGIVDDADKGYWVSYDYQLWTKNFVRRTPNFGLDYSFNYNEDDPTANQAINTPGKISGKYGSFSQFNQEMYYLNSVKTSSHTALFVRDIRLDGYSDQGNYDNKIDVNINATTNPQTAWYGSLYDEGGPTLICCQNSGSRSMTISPFGSTSSDKVKISFPFSTFNIGGLGDADYLEVHDGPNAISPLIGSYSKVIGGTLPPDEITSSGNSVTIVLLTNTIPGGESGFQINWKPVWGNGKPLATPQLKLNKLILLRNEELYGSAGISALPVPSFITSANTLWDLGNTQAGAAKIYDLNWYNNNKAAIDLASLKTIEFNQDYSLARKYHNNINTSIDGISKINPPSTIQNSATTATGTYGQSGKLTLNEILSFENKHTKLTPSILFDYNASVPLDNPDYNPQAVDYWGFYKNDITTGAYSSYTTSTSKDHTDAWSLRKITSPLGGTVEVQYESDQYAKILKENGGFKGASKMFMLKNAIPATGTSFLDWTYTLEDDVTDFTGYSMPSGTISRAFIPSIAPTEQPDTKFLSYGLSTTITGINKLSVSQLAYSSTILPDYSEDTQILLGGTLAAPIYYTGNGYINYELPIGYNSYGGGIRVKSLITRSGTDAYTQTYTYSDGVASSEPDRFDKARQRLGANGFLYYMKLKEYNFDKHKMSPQIGYSTVTVQNLGQVNSSQGAITTKFITSDETIDNYKANIQQKLTPSYRIDSHGISTECVGWSDTTTFIEVVDKFSGTWGQVQETQMTDVNNNIISLTRNEYTNPVQGAIVENYSFLKTISEVPFIYDPNQPLACCPPPPCVSKNNTICILRNYPTILTKQTTYNKNMATSTEYIKFDEVTGTPTMIRTTEPNKGTTVARTLPAFRISNYAGMGPKSVNPGNNNILAAVATTKITRDSTITGNSDFASFAVKTWTDDLVLRKFNVSSISYKNIPDNNYFWTSNKSYSWIGPLGISGLYQASSLANFDFSGASIDSKWRFNEENTLLDDKGHVLETRAFNNRFASKKYGYNDKFMIASASNVNYCSFTYTGFEDQTDLYPSLGPLYGFGGEVMLNSGNDVTPNGLRKAHTGNYFVTVNGSTGPMYKVKYYNSTSGDSLQRARTYRASVWVHKDSPSDAQLVVRFDGTVSDIAVVSKNNANAIQIGDWILLTADIYVPYNYASTAGGEFRVYLMHGGGTAYFDDLMLHPVDAPMSANVIDPKTGRVMATLDNNNFATIPVYDDAGRVIEQWQEIEGVGLKKVLENQFNYRRGVN